MTKPKRLSAQDSRSLMIEAGARAIEAEGLRVAVDNISIDRAIRDTGVPRSSAYNAWTNEDPERTPQETYRRAVLHHVIVEGVGKRSRAPMVGSVQEILGRAETMTHPQLKRAIIRAATNAHYDSSQSERGLRVGLGLLAAGTSGPIDEQDEELLEWLRQAEAEWRMTLIEGVFKPLAGYLEMRPKQELAGPLFWMRFVTAVMAMGAGLYPRYSITDPGVIDDFTLPGPGNEPEEWSLLALMVEAMFDRCFERIPSIDPRPA